MPGVLCLSQRALSRPRLIQLCPSVSPVYRPAVAGGTGSRVLVSPDLTDPVYRAAVAEAVVWVFKFDGALVPVAQSEKPARSLRSSTAGEPQSSPTSRLSTALYFALYWRWCCYSFSLPSAVFRADVWLFHRQRHRILS